MLRCTEMLRVSLFFLKVSLMMAMMSVTFGDSSGTFFGSTERDQNVGPVRRGLTILMSQLATFSLAYLLKGLLLI